ncbi:hypothetical protein A9Q78_11830 [Methylophaga sp. 41_12_T18]|nr:hypothetical protein A9Q78_11830 [Methylophaga sp. 41_12_T18]
MSQNYSSSVVNDFLHGSKSLNLPCELTIEQTHFSCTKILRLLPRKRLVLQAEAEQQQAVLKLFAKANKGEREYNRELRGHQLALASGVNVPQLLTSDDNVDHCFAIAYQLLDDAESFSAEGVRNKPENINKLLKMMAKMHEYGIFQDDIHLDNLMLHRSDVYLIDLGSVKCEHENKPLSKQTSLHNLARLVAQFFPLEQAEILKLLPTYYQQRQWSWNDDDHYQFVKTLKSVWTKRKLDYLSKCFRNCTMTTYSHTFSREYAFRANFLPDNPTELIENIEQLMTTGKMLKAGNSATVVLVEMAGKQVVIKRYNIKSMWHLLRRTLRMSRAAMSWRNANLLEFINLPTLKPLGFIEQRMGWFRHTAYFISEYHESVELLDEYQRRQPTNDELEQINNIFMLMQNSQISHGDLKAQNLLIDDQGKVILIDLDAMQEHRSERQFYKAFNNDKKRFLRNWQDLKVKEIFTSLLF